MNMDKYTKPDFSSIALITIDTQQDTLDGQPLEIPGTSTILPNMQKLLNKFRKIQLPIIHIVRLYKGDGSNVDLCRIKMVESGAVVLQPRTDGCELAKELLPEPGLHLDTDLLLDGGIQQLGPREVVIYKPRWGAFYKTALEEHLMELGVTSLLFTGCNFPNCPRSSIYEASERDHRIVLAEDAVSGLYKRGIDEMQNIGISVMTTQELLRAITPNQIDS